MEIDISLRQFIDNGVGRGRGVNGSKGHNYIQ